MSSFPVQKSESVTLSVCNETSLGVASTIFQILQPNAGGIGSFYPKLKTVAPLPLSKNRQLEAPQIVDLDATPEITTDLVKDTQDAFCESWFLSAAQHPGGTNQALWSTRDGTLTARTTTAFTVTANGALQAGILLIGKGWVSNPNNTLLVVGASSTGTTINVAGGVAETPSGYVATLEVAGFRGASGDIQLDASGNLISTVADFTTMGLQVGMPIWVGGVSGGGNAFATAGYQGYALIAGPISAHSLPLTRRQWTVGSADTGTGKQIDIYFGRWLRNVPFGDAAYKEPTVQFELTYPKLSAGTTDEYVYAAGNLVDSAEFTFPAQNLATVNTKFIGTTIGNPTTTRASGASTAAAPLAIARYNTVSNITYLKVAKQSDDSVVSDDIDNWKLTLMNHVTAQKQQGFLGTKRDVVGKCEVSIDMTAYLTSDAALAACANNTTLQFGAGFRNTDGGIFINVPDCKCTDSPPTFSANSAVTLALKLGAFRDLTSNYTLSMGLFAFIPAS